MSRSSVAVLDTNYVLQPSLPPSVARRLLDQGKAAVWNKDPFTIILKSAGPLPEGITGRDWEREKRTGEQPPAWGEAFR